MSDLSKRLQQAPFLRIIISYATGIILAEWVSPPKNPLCFLISLSLILLLIFGKESHKQEVKTGPLILIIFLSLGFSWSVHRRYVPKELPCKNYVAVLDEYPSEKGNSLRATIKLMDSGIKLFAYFDKSEDIAKAQPGMLLFFNGQPQLITNQGNPFEFDYQKYARRNNIGHRIYLKKKDYHFLASDKLRNLRYDALILREKLLSRLHQTGVEGETFKVISAITLGARDNMDPETTKSFSRTGTLHVLAVSGGNVAVIYVFLYLFFGFLNKGKTVIFFTIFILSGIWAYTLITGLSPSVLRAAVMFSFITAGKSIKRGPDMYNILASSAFILLFIKPSLLFDVGFQLSYAAVFAIVFLQPKLFNLFYSRYWIIDKFWLFFTVSVAAQVGTLPFSLWYFHQFPVYFWLSNIVVIPLVSLLLYLTLFVILSAPFVPFIANFTAQVLTLTGNMMLRFLHFVEYLPCAVIENIYPTVGQLFFTTLFITLAILYILYRKSLYALMALSFFLILIALCSIDLWKIRLQNEIVIFNSRDRTLIAFTKGAETTWLTDRKTSESATTDYLIRPYEGFRRIRKSERLFLDNSSFQTNSLLSIRKNFINYCGLNIYLSQLLEERIIPENFPPIDILFFIKSYPQAYMKYSPTGVGVVKINPTTTFPQNKASLPGEISSAKEKALIIKIDQKATDKRIIEIRNW